MLESLFVAIKEAVPIFERGIGEEVSIETDEPFETREMETFPEDINNYNPESLNTTDVGKLKEDDIGLQEDIEKFGEPDFIDEVREKNENMDKVMTRAEEVLKNNPSEIELQKTEKTLERYKGTIFENQLKDVLEDKFNHLEKKQRIVETEFGATKPDIVLKDAKEDMNISDLEIKKGEDLYIEAKAGSADYIQSEMPHILKQVEGHEGNSLVVVTKEYEKIPVESRVVFEQDIKGKGSHIYVADISANQLDLGIRDSLKI
jgi:hypothetical protein